MQALMIWGLRSVLRSRMCSRAPGLGLRVAQCLEFRVPAGAGAYAMPREQLKSLQAKVALLIHWVLG